MSGEITLDHLALITSRVARRRAYRQMRNLLNQKPTATLIRVLHEADDSCCAREPWLKTASRLWGSLGEKVLVLVL